MHQSTRKTAMCGIFAALSAAVMFCGGMIPLATFVTPAVAGAFLMPVAEEFGIASGLLSYLSVGLISFFVVPDREISLIFIFFLGYYPIIKRLLDKLHPGVIQWLVKTGLFNFTVFAMYSLIIFVFPINAVVEEFGESTALFWALLLAMANLAFVLYDRALGTVRALYLYRLRPRLMKK